ncbi:MAG TPA: FkbM family methyltransferase [Woeseiaceae bacterium]|nr:FkbM family methyltransferase [Woeseiaceae bacterium]
MAIAAWKRLEKTPGYQCKKLFFKRLVGRELRLRPEVDVRAVRDGGWWFHPDVLGADSIVWSLGVGEDVDFDLALIRRFHLRVDAFDPTPSTVEWLATREMPENFHFHPWAVTAQDSALKLYPRVRKDGSKSTVMYSMVADEGARDDAIVVPAFCLQSIQAELGQQRLDLLKMDIEGAEYEVLDNLLRSPVKPLQLLVEFHHRFAGIGLARTEETIARLRACGYRIFAVSETGREVSFIRSAEGG